MCILSIARTLRHQSSSNIKQNHKHNAASFNHMTKMMILKRCVSQVAPILKIGIRKLAATLYSQQANEIQSQVKKEHNPSTGCYTTL